jgi:two-component system, chemotaxis family, CheB/CheR fusion protein
LHDDLQQRLFAIKMQLSFLHQAYQEGRLDAITADRQSLETGLEQAIETTRRLSIDVSPVILQGSSLADALAWLKDEVKQRYGLDVDVEIKGGVPNVDEHIRVLLFNTLRELLFNVVKHSETLEASIGVEAADRRLLITVTDHGRGFDAEKIMSDPKAAHGLMDLHNRLDLIGCRMRIESKPGDGTTVRIEVPT